MPLEDIHGLMRDLERRVAALEGHPAIRNMSLDGPKPSVPAPQEWHPPAPKDQDPRQG